MPPKAKKETKTADCRFGDYRGTKRWFVTAPRHTTCLVAAPDEASAIAATAKHFGETWQKISFYAYCTVTPVRPESTKRSADAK